MDIFLLVFVVLVFGLSLLIVLKIRSAYKPVEFIKKSGFFGTLNWNNKDGSSTVKSFVENNILTHINIYSSDVSRFYNYDDFWNWLKLDKLDNVKIEIVLKVAPSCELYKATIQRLEEEKSQTKEQSKKLIDKISNVYHSSSSYIVNKKNKWVYGLFVQFYAENGQQILFITDSFKHQITDYMSDDEIIKLCNNNDMNRGTAVIYTSEKNFMLCRVADKFFNETKEKSEILDKDIIFSDRCSL